MPRRPCLSSYGAVVREMARRFRERAPAANDVFRPWSCCCSKRLLMQTFCTAGGFASVSVALRGVSEASHSQDVL